MRWPPPRAASRASIRPTSPNTTSNPSVSGETPKVYGSGPDSDQFAFAFRTGAKAFRLEFPAPRYESKLDIIEFRR